MFDRLQEMVEKLQQKIRVQKRQIEEAEEVATQNLSKFRPKSNWPEYEVIRKRRGTCRSRREQSRPYANTTEAASAMKLSPHGSFAHIILLGSSR
ncbi:hypothetical protein OSTOST_24752 [Ostertagia ostertagi]